MKTIFLPAALGRAFPGCIASLFFLLVGCAHSTPQVAEKEATPALAYCKRNEACWPTMADWRALQSSLTGELVVPNLPLAACQGDAGSESCEDALHDLTNPFALEDRPGGTQSTGWLGAWTASASEYAIVAKDRQDIVAAVNFARQHRMRLVIKATGHDYLGRSNAPDSLMVWTHELRDVRVVDDFVAQGCDPKTASPAVSVAAGARWIEVYQAATVKRQRYVQGGGCTTVGAAGGFLQGGGFGSWSKNYGIAAASLLEAEVVTADGKILVANACQNQDLFWALKGGGGGTYGVVTNVTLMTHTPPRYFGWVHGKISATSDVAFQKLITRVLRFYGRHLNNERWGEQISVHPDNTLELGLAFIEFSSDEAKQLWKPLTDWIDSHPDRYKSAIRFSAVPSWRMWNYSYFKQHAPNSVVEDTSEDASPDNFFWADDQGQVGMYWYAYQSRWIPADLFKEDALENFADQVFAASRHWTLSFHFNKGQAGASRDAKKRGHETSINPAVFNAAALVVAASGSNQVYPGVAGHEPDKTKGEHDQKEVAAAMKIIRDLTPGAGTYSNEADYSEPNWQTEFWGENYAKLLQIKKKYDPSGVFTCHHCVGSE